MSARTTKQRIRSRARAQRKRPALRTLALERLDSLESQLQSSLRAYTIALNDLGKNDWRMTRPLLVTVEQRGSDDFVACFYDVDVYGYGNSIPDSLEDLKKNIVSQYEFLLDESRRVELSAPVAEQFRVLLRTFERENAHARS